MTLGSLAVVSPLPCLLNTHLWVQKKSEDPFLHVLTRPNSRPAPACAVRKESTQRWKSRLGRVAHAYDPSTWESQLGGTLEFQVNLVYTVSSRTADIPSQTLS